MLLRTIAKLIDLFLNGVVAYTFVDAWIDL